MGNGYMRTGFSPNKLSSAFLLIVLLANASLAYAEQELNRLMLTPEQRAQIDQDRLNYLKSQQVKHVEDEPVEEKPKQVVSKPPYKKRVILPKKLSVSAVIVNPDGSRLIRINDQFNKSPSKHVSIDYQKSNVKGADLQVNKKEVFIPVGSTYLPAKNTIIESYKLDQKAAKANPKQQILKADDRSVKRDLKDVKTVNTPNP
ncbi:MAG: hypothetical protein R3189_00040 [Thiomicrorhabdus chilensis]|uniref:hypothetical protein n=1 Tax=Thiomicrorhabdus chilensis TaxID=63656 RepID=UPI000419A3A8|nr:hypothetical protein [Thiomicrorhabdus chilensis]MDX1346615.1 hypothetical protein [Thiomicrorhabdus chilensis]